MTPDPSNTDTPTPINTPNTLPVGGNPSENENRWIGGIGQRQERLENTVYVLVIVLLVGFATMFVAVGAIYVNAFFQKEASYQQLMIEISQQSSKIDQLQTTINAKLK